ncbi:MAG TPA: hypothetical protein P5137_18110, partial [Candidatus Brocadiia bacterium]|nr:hypothetical protein [Candidatus Brocadiia bacterium]
MPPYSLDTLRRLQDIAAGASLLRPWRPARYDQGDHLAWSITGVCPATPGRAGFIIDKFVGGGFAGQVYRARLDSLTLDGPPIPGFEPGRVYGLKILIPPSAFSRLFRNTIYWLAYQAPFAAQVNPAAVRAGALWKKVARRAASVRLGVQDAVSDIYATFYDPVLRSYGEVNEWVEGRAWKLEADDQLFRRWAWKGGDVPGSREFVAKRRFMASVVTMLHDMGAPELARQYEWWTLKSQPNCLKRDGHDDDPAAGLCAIDWRAGLALLPFLPMSPGDVKLILAGLLRGRLVQFDRGDMPRLDRFVHDNAPAFADMAPALDELSRPKPPTAPPSPTSPAKPSSS